MKRDKVIDQLESVKDNSKEFMDSSYDDIWANDIIALDYAIRAVKSDRRAKESFWAGVYITSLVFLLLIAADSFFKSYWGM